MAIRLSYNLLLLYVLHLYAILLIPTTATTGKPEKPVAFFIFGDSVLDPGNNVYINTTINYLANFWPYGETYFKYPTGRASDGRLICDFIAEYAKLPLIPPYHKPGVEFISGANFASGGAGALVETNQGFVIDLHAQLRNFKKVERWLIQKLGHVEAKKTISSAVYLFSIGGNDYLTPWLRNSTVLENYSHTEYVGMVIGNLTTVIKEIYKSGGRKFSFIGMAPLGCVPIMRVLETKGGCIKESSTLAKLHNKALSKCLYKLENELQGFKYSHFEIYNYISQVMNHPTEYEQQRTDVLFDSRENLAEQTLSLTLSFSLVLAGHPSRTSLQRPRCNDLHLDLVAATKASPSLAATPSRRRKGTAYAQSLSNKSKKK